MCVSSKDNNLVHTTTPPSKNIYELKVIASCCEINLKYHQGNISPLFFNFMANLIYVNFNFLYNMLNVMKFNLFINYCS